MTNRDKAVTLLEEAAANDAKADECGGKMALGSQWAAYKRAEKAARLLLDCDPEGEYDGRYDTQGALYDLDPGNPNVDAERPCNSPIPGVTPNSP